MGGKQALNKFVLSMVILRLLSGSIEIIAAFIMFRLNQIEKALIVNTGLALVGPIILITTTSIGLLGIADKLSVSKLCWIFIGVSCIFIGIVKK
ncbi:YqhV family protein [Chengkuizengella sp. SCS-71B]|uniref:YqhV family protein n=1 Tax=Chengkuizengella sp. SCS-71B TaxID=3115290 RepID=UPI0032C2107A